MTATLRDCTRARHWCRRGPPGSHRDVTPLVDDDDDVRRVVHKGHGVIHGARAREASASVAAVSSKLCVLIGDLFLPDNLYRSMVCIVATTGRRSNPGIP